MTTKTTTKNKPRVLPADYFYTLAELRGAGVMLSRSHLSRHQNIGDFPRPWRRPGELGFYLRSEVDAWVRRRRAMVAEITTRGAAQ
jgi:predicted DNA-binding transcriptional regulator AlpA